VERVKMDENWGVIEKGLGDTNNVANKANSDAETALAKSLSAEQIALLSKLMAQQTQQQLDNIILNDGTGNAEVIQARGSEPLLKDRLYKNDMRLAETVTNIHGLKRWELNSKGRKNKAITAFTSDDGKVSEYNIALRLFRDAGVPQSIAVISDRVGSVGYLTKDQLLELQNVYGWEIMSHSKTHPVTSQGQTMIPDLPENEARVELYKSRDDLIAMGLNVESYVHPGGVYNTRERVLTREYYRSARVSLNGPRNGLNTLPVESHELKTIWLDPSTLPLRQYLLDYDKQTAIQKIKEDIYKTLDQANQYGGLVIISTHFDTINDSDFEQMYRDVIAYAKTKTIVTTVSKALDELGNIFESGDFSLYSDGSRRGGNHLAIGANGKTSGTLNIAADNEYDGRTFWRDFSMGETVCMVSTQVATDTNLPEKTAGVFRNFRFSLSLSGNNYQEYRVFRSNKTYYRLSLSDGTFGEWRRNSSTRMILPDEVGILRFSDGIEKYDFGETFELVRSATHPDINDAPGQASGLRKTVKVTDSNFYKFNYQEYHLNYATELKVYKRTATSPTAWDAWQLMSQKIN